MAPVGPVLTLNCTMNCSLTMFSSPVSISASAIDVVVARRRTDVHGAEAELFLEILRDRRLDHLLERPRQVIARARIGLAHDAAEAQHDAALVGRDDEDAAERVHQQEDRDDEPRIDARRSAVSEAVAQLVEDALDVRQRIVAPPTRRNVLPISHQLVRRAELQERNAR